MARLTAKVIIKAIGNDKLELVAGEGYWYFSYWDESANIYETHSVYVYRLKDLSLDAWIQEGKSFLALIP